MPTLEELEEQVKKLTKDEQEALRDWLENILEDEQEFTDDFKASIERGEQDLREGHPDHHGASEGNLPRKSISGR